MRIEISGRIAEIVPFDTLNPYDLHKYDGNLYIQSIEKETVFWKGQFRASQSQIAGKIHAAVATTTH